jgi:molecular chaperone DnaK (HSP70)
MARLGIDFGTTNTVAMIHDRGLLSEVLHAVKTGAGTIVQPIFPSAILIDKASGQRWFGIEADRRFGQVGPGGRHQFVSSLKSRLRDYTQGRKTTALNEDDDPEQATFDVADLLRSFFAALAESIRQSQSLSREEHLEAVITWPANANGAQRYITRKCFREAGFTIIETLNEPTASAIELADCLTAGRTKHPPNQPAALAVFDLGGGTFDASVVWVEAGEFHVLASGGIEDLGGDNLDNILLDMFLRAMKDRLESLGDLTRHALLRQSRAQKETLSAGVVKSLFLNPKDFGLRGTPVSIPVEVFYERVRPLLRPALKMLKAIIEQATTKEPRVRTGPPLTIYLVGGSSKLPLVAEMVSHAFPAERVVLTDKPFLSVAMGAAICATQHVSFRDVFARHFGLIRLKDHGRAETFDPIFPAGTSIPRRGEPVLEKVAYYHPRHNIGHLRYLECTAVGPDGLPAAGVRAWSDIRFPYDPVVPLSAPLDNERVVETAKFAGQPVREVYRCDCDGVITVELQRHACRDSRTYEICRD